MAGFGGWMQLDPGDSQTVSLTLPPAVPRPGYFSARLGRSDAERATVAEASAASYDAAAVKPVRQTGPPSPR